MTTYLAFLRGINVGGGNMLPMKELSEICEDVGFKRVRTYINSGNVIFESGFPSETLRKKLEEALLKKRGKKIEVSIRTDSELKAILAKNPFPKAQPSKIGVVFLSHPLPKDYLKDFTYAGPEEIKVSAREIYVHYPSGMGRSKLKLPRTSEQGTVRNMNTVAKLVALCGE
jgi:uncharacterized protein (DUF1697 family)